MNNDLKKFEELARTDAAFQDKLRTAAEKFEGDKNDPKAIFDSILLPVGKEYGLSATYEEFEEYTKGLTAQGELSEDELTQVAGGKGGGAAAGACMTVGLGVGGGGMIDDHNGAPNAILCVALGVGFGGLACWGSGDRVKI